MKLHKVKVLVKYNGEKPMSARLVGNGKKVEWKKGDVKPVELKKAQALCTTYARYFELVDAEASVAPKKVAKKTFKKEEL